MASTWKHPNSKYWTACYTDGNGKQRKKSTKLTDKKAAQKIADSLEDAHKRKMSETQIRKIFSEAYHEIHGMELKSATIGKYMEDWVDRKKGEIAESTLEKYRRVAERFVEHMGNAANNDINYLTTKTFVDFRNSMEKELSRTSVNNYLKILRVAFNDAWRDNLISENPAAKVPALKNQNGDSGDSRRKFEVDELRKLLPVANEEWRGIILCGAYTGQRLGDVAGLTWANVDLQQNEIHLVTQKTGRTNIIPLAEPLKEHILTMDAADDPQAPLFPKAHAILNKHGKTALLSNQFYQIMVAAGLAKPRSHQKQEGSKTTRNTNPLSFHCLRHTATSLMKNAGISEAVAMDIIGHESKAISRNYTHIDRETKKKAIEGMPDIRES